MIYLFIGLGLLFIAIGYLVSENNARYLLSGFNTLSKEEQEKFDIKSFIPYSRKFHLFLGISFVVIGVALTYLISENAGGIFLCVYPIVAYIYFMWKAHKLSKGTHSPWAKTHSYILVGSLIFVIALLRYGFREDELLITPHGIEIEGIYGEDLLSADILSVSLVNKVPVLTRKNNGFALGTIKKGYFSSNEGPIKLILNSENKPCILIQTKSGKKIYYSGKETDNSVILAQLEKALPSLVTE